MRVLLLVLLLLSVNTAVLAETLTGKVEEEVSQIEVKLQEQAPVVEVRERRGEIPVGVLGATINNDTGIIEKVYPGSYLARFRVRAGDRLISINGKPFNPGTIRQYCTGSPGQLVVLEVSRAGVIYTLEVPLVDSRLLKYFHPYFRKQAEKTRRW